MISRCRLLPYKGKWQHMFSERLAMEELKNKVNEKCSSNDDLIGDLIQRSLFLKLPPVLNHLEEAESFETSERLFISIIRSYGAANMLQEAVDVLFRIPKFRCSPSVRSLNSLLSVLCKREEGLGLVPDVLLRTPQMNLRLEDSSFRILMRALCKNGKAAAAVELLEAMKLQGWAPDPRMYSLILSSLYKHAGPPRVISFFEDMKAAGISPNTMDYTCVMNVLVKEGRADDAWAILRQMRSDGSRPSVANYTAVLGGLISAGDFQKTEAVFDEMLVSGLRPDSSAYNTYINGLCKQGAVEKACKMLVCMGKRDTGQIQPPTAS
ncbi:unnamed protein product [Spirodela intermedia]|uniref:PROP1-like PPR domain-containing protein n=1 Tax=Spirodela intermedia TaxID=51605 RepID=A0A7I8IGD1_SPIIN|nr:unnamed protein product [Spirodela intermedia]CAA6656928.1 unnamed protein product [Spirodela intermedia]